MPVWGSIPSATLNGAAVPRRSPRAPRYRLSLWLLGNSESKRETEAAVGTCIGKLAVECKLFCWKPAKKKVLFLRTGPPAVNPKILLLNTDCGIPVSLFRFEIEL